MRISSARLRRAERLRDRRDYQRLAKTGRRASSSNFVVLAVQRDDTSGPRLGITASRRVGGAVQRNRVKRRIREWFRRSKGEIATDLDLVVIARRSAVRQEPGAGAAELSRLVREAVA